MASTDSLTTVPRTNASSPQAAGLSASETAEIRAVILRLLRGLDVRYPKPFVVPPEFWDACDAKARECGFALSGPFDLRRYMPVGAVMACAPYPLVDERRRVFIAVYTAVTTMLDDLAPQIDACKRFAARVMAGLPHEDATLDAFVRLLKDTAVYSAPVLTELTISNTLNFFAALTLEELADSMPIDPQAEQYAAYKRHLSGISGFYSSMMFPPSVPLSAFVQAAPYLVNLTNEVNDVLSFYKEEAAGETANLVSDMASTCGITSLEALGRLTDRCIEMHKTATAILGHGTPACEAYEAYMRGYVQFHVTLPRYRLDELDIPVGAPFPE